MADDWRLHVTTPDAETARAVAERLGSADIEHELDAGFGERVIVSREGGELFLYASERAQAERAAVLVGRLAAAAATELTRWHPASHTWEAADAPLPAGEDQLAAEHARLVAEERQESRERGFPLFEVSVACGSRGAAGELAARLRAEGLQVTQRWRYLLIGAEDEDRAAELARRIAAELSSDAELAVGASARELLSEQPRNPFSVLGGLGG